MRCFGLKFLDICRRGGVKVRWEVFGRFLSRGVTDISENLLLKEVFFLSEILSKALMIPWGNHHEFGLASSRWRWTCLAERGVFFLGVR